MNTHNNYKPQNTMISIELGYLKKREQKGPLGMKKVTYTLRAVLRINGSMDAKVVEGEITEQEVKLAGEDQVRAALGSELAAAVTMAAIREEQDARRKLHP